MNKSDVNLCCSKILVLDQSLLVLFCGFMTISPFASAVVFELNCDLFLESC